MSIAPSELCTDYEFVRRAYLDCIGRMPTTAEAKAFLDDKDAKKRDKLIDALLERPEFADFWALKWADVLRSSRKTIQVKGSYGFQAWLREQFQENTPLDKVVQEHHHRQRQHLRQPAGELLPHRQGPAEPGRDDRPALPRRADAVREVPQPPVRALDPGRLLRHGRVLRAGEDQARAGRRHAAGRAGGRRGRGRVPRPRRARSRSRAPARR